MEELRAFAAERDWEQFHSPKNLVMGLASEAGELLDVFRWLSEEESRRIKQDQPGEYAEARKELADILIYLLRLADTLDIELEAALQEKMRINAEKYPIALAQGNARKYNRRPGSEKESNAGGTKKSE
ncbi:MAG: nucleotide pyrophosphohydrolase [Ectothiorhodospiraceae bacterium]|nr:nucleotide pyrophosphohydrolase [Ectothiorhodospiraceae bacterium]